MYRLLVTLALYALAVGAQKIDQNILDGIFGKPTVTTNTPATVTQPFIVPTTGPTIINKDGESCTCVPYYLCDADQKGIYRNNKTVTGWGELDIRFGASPCQESVERCCTSVSDPATPTVEPTTSPPLKACGYRNPNGLDFTITGGDGDEALFGELPWIVALLNTRNNSYVGVGVLIHPQVVMTAAHIANRYQPGQLAIRAGEWDTQTEKERLKHQERSVAETFSRPDAHPQNLFNDIALLRLAEPVQLDAHINVLCLPEQDESFDTSKGCVVGGWGKDKFGAAGKYAIILKRVEQNIIPNDRCQTLLRRTRLGLNFNLHNTFVCAGGEEGKDTCQGDGGAPLACPIGDNRYKLTGLVAWGIGCGIKEVPAVYASVAKFRNWVDQQMAVWGLDIDGYRV